MEYLTGSSWEVAGLHPSNAKYKLVANEHRMKQHFSVDHWIMMYFRHERFLAGRYSKLSWQKFAHFQIQKKFGENAYIDLPPDLTISSMFNVLDLYKFYGDPSELEEISELPFSTTKRADNDNIEDVVNVKTTETKNGLHRRYLVPWPRRFLTDSSWISEAKLRWRQEDIYWGVTEAFSSEASSSQPGKISAP